MRNLIDQYNYMITRQLIEHVSKYHTIKQMMIISSIIIGIEFAAAFYGSNFFFISIGMTGFIFGRLFLSSKKARLAEYQTNKDKPTSEEIQSRLLDVIQRNESIIRQSRSEISLISKLIVINIVMILFTSIYEIII